MTPEREAAAVVWAERLATEPHHHRCKTRHVGGACDCYKRRGEYSAADLLLAERAARARAIERIEAERTRQALSPGLRAAQYADALDFALAVLRDAGEQA